MKEEKEKKTVQKKVKKTPVKKKVRTKKITDLDGNVIEKEIPKKESLFVKIKRHFKKYKKIYIPILLGILAILLISFIYIGIRNYILHVKYGKYEETVERYGFSLLYNNESAKSSDRVTRAEMVKLVVASVYNITEVESKGFFSDDKFKDDEWTKLAVAFGIIDKYYVTEETYDENATYMEALTTYLNARSKVLNIPVSSKESSKFKNLNSYTVEERKYINDAAENGLIENTKKRIKLNSDLFKGEFNELIVKFVEKYNTVAPEGETLVLKEESKPSNYDIYPYTLYSVDKEVYEYEGINEGGTDYKTPKETYMYRKDYYSQVEYRAENYYNEVLNIDYTKIDKAKFLESASAFLRYDYSDEINEYLDYVKNNKIIIEGSAKVQFPIFYLDGIRYRARIKLEFEIKSADTDKNILLGDLARDTEVTYKDKKYVVYVDAPMGTALFSNSLFLDMMPIIDIMVSDKEASELNEM